MSSNAEAQAIEKMREYYKNLVMPICDNCKSNTDVIPCVYGRPNKELSIYANAGFAKLAGCCMDENMKEGYCKKCEAYIYQKK